MTRFESVGVFIRETVWLRLFSSHTFSRINTPTFSNLVILHTYPPTKMEQCVPKRRHKISDAGELPRRKHTTSLQWLQWDFLFPAPIRTVHISLYRHPTTSDDHRHIQPCITPYDELFYFPLMSARAIRYQPSCHDCFIVTFRDAKILLQRWKRKTTARQRIPPWYNLSKSRFLTIRKVNWLSGFGGLGVPKFAGSNPAEAVGFLRAKKS